MAEINEQKTYYRKLNKPKTRSLEKINKLDKHPGKLNQEK